MLPPPRCRLTGPVRRQQQRRGPRGRRRGCLLPLRLAPRLPHSGTQDSPCPWAGGGGQQRQLAASVKHCNRGFVSQAQAVHYAAQVQRLCSSGLQ